MPVILLVDDSEEILDYLSQSLSGKYHVHTATDGHEALAILQNEWVQLVVSDVVMPRMDGFELCTTIKSTAGLCHIPIILLTGKSCLESKIDGLKTGADAYIEKPFSLDLLLAQIDNLLENRTKLKESYARSPLLHAGNTPSSKEEAIFWKSLTDLILSKLSDTDLNVERIAQLMNMSKSTLSRKIKYVSGLSPSDVINLVRLRKSTDLISAGNFRVNELAKAVGYHYPAQFRRNFKKQFKMPLAQYIKKVRQAISIKITGVYLS
ncbi:MAG: response regulator [Niastella sp.]|nr:response regulator [Niastella sp.]